MLTSFFAYRRQTDRELEGRLSWTDILDQYHAKPAQIARLQAGGQLAGIPRRGRVWFAKDDVDRHFQPRG